MLLLPYKHRTGPGGSEGQTAADSVLKHGYLPIDACSFANPLLDRHTI